MELHPQVELAHTDGENHYWFMQGAIFFGSLITS